MCEMVMVINIRSVDHLERDIVMVMLGCLQKAQIQETLLSSYSFLIRQAEHT